MAAKRTRGLVKRAAGGRPNGGRPVNKFSVSHLAESEFRGEGLRPYFVYRDLGIKAATGGRVGAHVIRAAHPCNGGTGRHRHRLAVQLVYVLRGWVRFWYQGEGEIELVAGSCVHQPPGILHELIDCSTDCEVLEITLPAEFATIEAPQRPERGTRAKATRRGRPRAEAA
jgi:uncharacterized RmlC-like cupin family protein